MGERGRLSPKRAGDLPIRMASYALERCLPSPPKSCAEAKCCPSSRRECGSPGARKAGLRTFRPPCEVVVDLRQWRPQSSDAMEKSLDMSQRNILRQRAHVSLLEHRFVIRMLARRQSSVGVAPRRGFLLTVSRITQRRLWVVHDSTGALPKCISVAWPETTLVIACDHSPVDLGRYRSSSLLTVPALACDVCRAPC